MNTHPQIIFDNGKPAFIVLRYEEYAKLMGKGAELLPDDLDCVPFVLSDYISNPIRIARIEAGLNQQQLAKLLGVTQGYVSRIEARTFKVPNKLLKKIKELMIKHRSRKGSR